MATTKLTDLFYQLHEWWTSGGQPAETFGPAGVFYKMLYKGSGSDGGWQGNNQAKMPVRSSLNGNVGHDHTKTFNFSVPAQGQQFLINGCRLWNQLLIEDETIAYTRNATYLESSMSGLMDEMEQKAKGWMRAISYLLWHDGRQLLGKGDSAYSVAGTAITFLNTANRHKFEVGDVITLIDTAVADATDPGVVPVPRAGTLTVTKVLVDGLEVDAAVNTIVGATNADYISKSVYEVTDGRNINPLTGVFGFLAETETQAAKTFYGVDRSIDTNRLAGLRVNLTGSESPWDICAAILDRADEDGSMIDTLFLPSSQKRALLNELASRNMQYTSVTDDIMQPQNLKLGVSGISVADGDMVIRLYFDRFLSDPDVTRDNDIRYVGLYSGECGIISADDAGWKDYDGDGARLNKVGGTADYVAEYGIFGQYRHTNPHNAIIAKVGANL